jgi:hypothetical protein
LTLRVSRKRPTVLRAGKLLSASTTPWTGALFCLSAILLANVKLMMTPVVAAHETSTRDALRECL